MITISATKTIYCDIDNTLILWNRANYHLNHECLKKIKQFKKRGHTLIAWSAGGAEWAEKVVKRFKLQKYFVLCVSKPDWYMDDLKVKYFMPERNRIPF